MMIKEASGMLPEPFLHALTVVDVYAAGLH